MARLRWKRGIIVALAVLALAFAGSFLRGWYGGGPLKSETAFIVPDGSTLTSVAAKLEKEGAIGSSQRFLALAKVLGSGDAIKAGEFLLPAHASGSRILDTLQHGKAMRRLIAVPEGMPSIM